MKKRAAAVASVLLGLLCLDRGVRHFIGGRDETGGKDGSHLSAGLQEDAGSDHRPSKASQRGPDVNANATHRPEKLREFYLPEVVIDGLTLKEALAKLEAAYEEVCRGSGEVPLHLSFVIPDSATRPLIARTGIRNFDSSVRLLAAMAGLTVKRTGSEYVFTAPEESGKEVTKTFQMPPNLFSSFAPDSDPSRKFLRKHPRFVPEFLEKNGVTIDPSTRFRMDGSTLRMESASAADRVTMAGMIDSVANETPVQHKTETRMIKIGAGVGGLPEDFATLDDAGMQALMEKLGQTKGVEIVAIPATLGRPGESARVEMTRQFIMPSPTVEGEFISENVGIDLHLQSSPYGLGHHVDMHLAEKVVEEVGGLSVFSFRDLEPLTDSSFARDGKSRLHVQTHPDGSRSVVMVTPTLVDATGRPVHEK